MIIKDRIEIIPVDQNISVLTFGVEDIPVLRLFFTLAIDQLIFSVILIS